MFFTDIHARDFIELLGALPSSPATTRAHILGAFGVLVTGDDPVGWWDALTRDRGEEGAAQAVAQLVISKGGKRVLALIKADAAGRSVTPRADDSKLVRLLFNMEWSGVPADKVRGILVAPAFSQKVLNSAVIEPRITLLRFNRGP